jgi:hypothetical protein
MNTSISFWTLEGTYQPETAKAERNSDSTFEEVIVSPPYSSLLFKKKQRPFIFF